jgi:hypothetical protein
MSDIRVGWGFEIQRYRIVPRNIIDAPIPAGAKFSKEGNLWIPNSRLITAPNLVMDLAQIELIKAWRSISGSVRKIQSIAVGSSFADPARADTTLGSQLASKDIDSWNDVDLTPVAGLSKTKAQVTWFSAEANGTIAEIGLKFDNGDLVTHAAFLKLTISGATQTDPVRITTTAAHGLTTGDEVHIDNIVGMTEINNRNFTVTVFDADEFDLDGEDGTGHTAYSSVGNAWLIITKTTSDVVQTNYLINVQS